MTRDERLWIDLLHQKHECFSYDSARHITVEVQNKTYSVKVPSYLPEMKVLQATCEETSLFLIGITTEKLFDRPAGFIMVAHRIDQQNYHVVIWHETYPYAIENLGLISPPDSK